MKLIKKGEKYFIKKKVANGAAMAKGIECESEEHPTMDPEAVKTLVQDHLKEDPQFYDDYMAEEETEVEEDDDKED